MDFLCREGDVAFPHTYAVQGALWPLLLNLRTRSARLLVGDIMTEFLRLTFWIINSERVDLFHRIVDGFLGDHSFKVLSST